MHTILDRHLRRNRLDADAVPQDPAAWSAFLDAVSKTLDDTDNDRYLLERSLAISSDEMGELHTQLADERDMIDSVICSLAEGVCALDGDNRIIFLNPEAARILRLPEGTNPGKTLDQITGLCLLDGKPITDLFSAGKPSLQKPDIPLRHEPDAGLKIVCNITELRQITGGHVLTLRDVTEQTRVAQERDALHRQLVDASRRAGMADVATCVLHNVGNVLNSINVSVSLLMELVRDSEIATVSAIADMLPNNPESLARFVQEDNRGRLVPSLLTKIGTKLSAEQKHILEELGGLVGNIEHIREVVSSQQSFARGGNVLEDVDLVGVIDEAVKINEAALRRHNVVLVTEYENVGPVHVDHHKVLQILVNLISNAKYAMDGKPPSDRIIRLMLNIADNHGDRRLVIKVSDNGQGMTDEIRNRVFEHGFTTRREGHGFGLHYCALTAKELGGELMAHSDGPGQGATFTLTLPYEVSAIGAG